MKSSKSSPAAASLSTPSHEQITRLAHTLWLEEGKPEGRDLHHWLEAERQLAAGGGATRGKRKSTSEETRGEIEADKRVDGLGPESQDPRTPKGERL